MFSYRCDVMDLVEDARRERANVMYEACKSGMMKSASPLAFSSKSAWPLASSSLDAPLLLLASHAAALVRHAMTAHAFRH